LVNHCDERDERKVKMPSRAGLGSDRVLDSGVL